VTRLKCRFGLVRLEIVVILTQDRCIVCAKHTIGLEIILDTLGGTPR
jgi:hypothetical protein